MREKAIEDLNTALSSLRRRRRDLSEDIHPGLTLVGYTILTQIETTPGVCAADLVTIFGLDKSTISRQICDLEAEGLIRREVERPGRRGFPLVVTPAGKRRLASAATRLCRRLKERLVDWDEGDIETFAQLIDRFNRFPD